MIDHDRLFKELLSTFFFEFLELFLPKVARFVRRETLTALDKEVFTDVTLGETHEVDLLMQAQFKRREVWFLLHLETQSYKQANFNERMFHYFARLSEKHHKPVYPIVVFSYDEPLVAEPDSYKVRFPNKTVLQFNYDVIQLNRLDWHDYVNRPNPVASALMSKMQIAPADRVSVKLACLRMLAGLRLNKAQERLISGFTDVYLRLNGAEDQTLKTEVERLGLVEKEGVMEIVTSWMEDGIKIGRQEGKAELLLEQLETRFGKLDVKLQDQIKNLSPDLFARLSLSFFTISTRAELLAWLERVG